MLHDAAVLDIAREIVRSSVGQREPSSQIIDSVNLHVVSSSGNIRKSFFGLTVLQ